MPGSSLTDRSEAKGPGKRRLVGGPSGALPVSFCPPLELSQLEGIPVTSSTLQDGLIGILSSLQRSLRSSPSSELVQSSACRDPG